MAPALELLASAGQAVRQWADDVDHSISMLSCWEGGASWSEHGASLAGPPRRRQKPTAEPDEVWTSSGSQRAATTMVFDNTAASGAALPLKGDRHVAVEDLREALLRVPRPRPGAHPSRLAEPAEPAAPQPPEAPSAGPGGPRRPGPVVGDSLEAGLARLRALNAQFQGAWSTFVDAEFPEAPVQLDGKHTVCFWGRTHDITRHDDRALVEHDLLAWLFTPQPDVDWRLFRDKPRALDVQQGELGDCWFLSSLGALAEYEDGRHVRALLPSQSVISEAGAYLVRLCIGGRWRNVVVDDRLPCIGGGRFYVQLACCVTHRLQIWASVIEKAYAKACGSYERIVGGEAGEALSVLTGWPCRMTRFCSPDFEVDTFWATLCSSRDAGFLMTCSTCETKNEAAHLEPFHVYLLLSVFEVPTHDGGYTRLVKIRNQQEREKIKWTGAWSSECPNWTPSLREQLEYPVGSEKMVFFMALGDFLRQFAHCTICQIRAGDSWHQDRMAVELPAGRPPRLGARLDTSASAAECSVSLSQPEERARQGPLFPGLPKEEACLGFVVLQNGPGGGLECGLPAAVQAVASMRSVSAVSADCWLAPGSSYTVVPLSLPWGPAVPAALAAFSSRPVEVREAELSLGQVRVAWAAYARSVCSRGESFRGATLYMGKSEGGSLVALAENRGSGHLCVELSLSSGCLLFSRGAAQTTDWLPPGYAQVLQVAVPAEGSRGSAGWRSQHKFQMASKSPHRAMQTPPLPEADTLHTPFRMSDGLPLLGLSSL